MTNSFEQSTEYDTKIEHADIEAAHERAKDVLSDPINPEDFRDIYGENVNSDLAYVQKMENKFEEDRQKMSENEQHFLKVAKVFEAIVFQHAELSNWFGETAMTMEASRYDDIKNGVDTIVEFEEENTAHHLALAIDVTSSSSIFEKFDRIKKEIDNNKLAEIKYFVSEHLNIRGHKSNVPRVVIGADRKTIYNVVNAWIEEDMEALAQHPIQIKILSEIKLQLEGFKEYCEKWNHTDLAEIYAQGLKIIDGILSEKAPTEDQLAELEFDEVYRAIQARTNNIRNSQD